MPQGLPYENTLRRTTCLIQEDKPLAQQEEHKGPLLVIQLNNHWYSTYLAQLTKQHTCYGLMYQFHLRWVREYQDQLVVMLVNRHG